MAQFIFPPQTIDTTGLATEAEQILQTAELVAINAELDSQTALLTTIDADTGSIDSKLNTLGQKTMANSMPVALASDQSSIPVTGPLTDAELRATPVPVSGPLTDTELRATPVDVLGPLTDTELRATPVPVSGPLTDTELRATPVDVLGPLTDTELRATPVDVLGPLTDTELRASAVPVSVASLPLPSGASTLAEQQSQTSLLTTIDADTGSIDTKLTMTNSELSAVNTELDSQTALLTTIDADTGNIATSTSSIDTKLTTTNSTLSTIDTSLNNIEASVDSLTPVDQIDTTPLLDVSGSNIPASASNPLQIVASTAAAVRKVVSVEDIGEFIGLYTGAAASEVLLCVLPLGGGEIEVEIPASTRISLRHMKNTAITSGFISVNFLG